MRRDNGYLSWARATLFMTRVYDGAADSQLSVGAGVKPNRS